MRRVKLVCQRSNNWSRQAAVSACLEKTDAVQMSVHVPCTCIFCFLTALYILLKKRDLPFAFYSILCVLKSSFDWSNVSPLIRTLFSQRAYVRRTRRLRKQQDHSTEMASSNIWRRRPWSTRTERTSCPSPERKKVSCAFDRAPNGQQTLNDW